MLFGICFAFPSEPSPEELELAKEYLVGELCNTVRKLAKEYPEEFFIIKDTRDFPIHNSVKTIAAKLDAPTISEKLKEE